MCQKWYINELLPNKPIISLKYKPDKLKKGHQIFVLMSYTKNPPTVHQSLPSNFHGILFGYLLFQVEQFSKNSGFSSSRACVTVLCVVSNPSQRPQQRQRPPVDSLFQVGTAKLLGWVALIHEDRVANIWFNNKNKPTRY